MNPCSTDLTPFLIEHGAEELGNNNAPAAYVLPHTVLKFTYNLSYLHTMQEIAGCLIPDTVTHLAFYGVNNIDFDWGHLNLIHLRIHSSTISYMPPLYNWPNLKTFGGLYLTNLQYLGDDFFTHPSLEVLEWQGFNKLQNTACWPSLNLPNLKRLHFGTHHSKYGPDFFDDVSSLEYLRFDYCLLHTSTFPSLFSNTLHTLVLLGCNFASFPCWNNMPNLKCLSIIGFPQTKNGFINGQEIIPTRHCKILHLCLKNILLHELILIGNRDLQSVEIPSTLQHLTITHHPNLQKIIGECPSNKVILCNPKLDENNL